MSVFEVSALTKRYGSFVAVQDLSFAVERGAVFGLLGQNGSGKTTTIACSLGLRHPSSGSATVLGKPAREMYATAGHVGVVFDAPVLVKGLTVRAQMAYSTRMFGHRGGRSIQEALALVGLQKLQHRRVTELSLGQQKRLAVATALAGDPQLLILDEPLSGLDPLGARDLLQLFTTLSAEGHTIVLSSHRLNDIEPVLTHAIILARGRLRASGTMQELLGARGITRVVVDDRQRARELLQRNPKIALRDGVESGALYVESGFGDPAEISRALVEGGLALRELRRADRSLSDLFESLADVGAAEGETEGEKS